MFNQQQQPGLFGQQQPQQQTGLFNQPQQQATGMFAQQQPQQQTGLFGQQQQPQQQQPGIFNQQAQQQQPTQAIGGLFQQQAAQPAGQQQTNVLGQQQTGQQQQQGGLFGQQLQAGLTGQNQAGVQGQQQTGLLGQQQGGVQGQQQPGLFGQQQVQQGLLGAQGQQQTGLLGQQQGGLLGQQPAGVLGQQQGVLQGQQQPGLLGQQGGQANVQPDQVQQQLPLDQVISKAKKETLKHIDNLIKAGEIREFLDSNHQVLKSVDKNALFSTQVMMAAQQQTNTQGLLPQQQLPQQQLMLKQQMDAEKNKTYTGKVIAHYNKYQSSFKNLQNNQDETLKNLLTLKNTLSQRQDYQYSQTMTEEDAVASQIESCTLAVEQVSQSLEGVIKMQKDQLTSQEDEGDDWEFAYKSLYQCLMKLNEDINDTDEFLGQLEKNPKIRQR